MTFALLASYLFAMTLVPTCASRLLAHRRGEDGGTARRPFEAWFEPLRERYGRFHSGALARKKTVLAIAALVFVASLGLYPLIGPELFPAVDAGQLMIRVRAPSGTGVERTEERVRQVEDVVRESVSSEDLQMLISNIGVLYDWPAAYTPNSGPMDAFLNLQLTENRSKTAQDYQALLRGTLRERFPGLELAFDPGGLMTAALNFGLPAPINRLNPSVNFDPAFWIDHNNGNHCFIGAQYREEDIESLETLKNVPITSRSQSEAVLLRNIATFERATAPAEVNHMNITRVIDVFASVEGRDIGSVAREIEAALSDLKTPDGYFVRMRGEVSSMRASFGSLGFGFVLAVALVYLVMVVQFRSFLDPLIVMFAVPLGIVGVLWMLFLTGTNWNIQSLMGVILMVGVVVAFSLLLVDFANRLRDEGKDAESAILEAARIRLRPILMTSLAASLGLVPMAVAGGANVPLARAVIGGILASTVLTLLVVPILYAMFKPGATPPGREEVRL